MGKCYVCAGKGNFKHLGREICRKCFMRNMEKRVKKGLGRKMFKRGDKVLVVGLIEEHLLRVAVKELPIEITMRKKLPVSVKGFDWVVYGKAMDEVNAEFILGLEEGKLELGGGKRKFFNILEVLTSEEISRYCSLKKIKYLRKEVASSEFSYNLHRNIKDLRLL